MSAAGYQSELIRHGIFVRGGIAIGPLWMDRLMVFGSGLNDAYELEHRVARYPRIVVSEQLVGAAHLLIDDISPVPRSWLGNFLIRGRDGQYFVNYLFDDQIAAEQGDTSSETGTYSGLLDPLGQSPEARFLEIHRAAIGEGLLDNQAIPEVYEKYLWAARYHNFYCHKYGYENEALPQPSEQYEFVKLGYEHQVTDDPE